MEQLQSLLKQYNLLHKEYLETAPWSKQYSEDESFPKYWGRVYSILQPLDKNYNVLEIGCGFGDVTAILCYLGFKRIVAFEQDKNICLAAHKKIAKLFGRQDVVKNEKYPNGKQYVADVLILVNCSYAEKTKTKQEYLDLMKQYYVCAGKPKVFLMEVIDAAYTQDDNEFPKHIRLSSDDVKELFYGCKISSWDTYKYPVNRKSKTLYLIERR